MLLLRQDQSAAASFNMSKNCPRTSAPQFVLVAKHHTGCPEKPMFSVPWNWKGPSLISDEDEDG